MTFLRITESHPYLERIQLWYEDAFPTDERRSFAELIALLPYPDMHLCALVSENQLVGFMIYWQWTTVVFIEHFVIDPALRGKKYGEQALASIKDMDYTYLLLEAERPEDEMSQRRIRFYERQGFWVNAFDYVQPPYQPGKEAVPMRLMSIPTITDEAEFIRLRELIKGQVYERFY